MNDTLTGELPAARTHRLVLPEGVPLDLELPALADRAGAFLLDSLILFGLAFAVALPAGLMGGAAWALALAQLVIFLVRTLYFVWFEVRWAGTTPGKRAAGLRVIARDGGPLGAGALFARNLTRELEVYLPAMLLLQPVTLGWTPSTTMLAVSAVWLLVLGCLPLLNRDRLRLGDLLAGTLVVRAPKVVLSRDQAALPSRPVRGRGRGRSPQVDAARSVGRASTVGEAGPSFHRDQLEHYGVYELQVLEDLLRDRSGDERALEVVATRIQQRIAWRGEAHAPLDFLRAFYRAQRERLEQDLLLAGEARQRKRDPPPPAS